MHARKQTSPAKATDWTGYLRFRKGQMVNEGHWLREGKVGRFAKEKKGKQRERN